ncbi:peptidylprolyl isomerase [Anaerosacchariphilus polymeriproducens]|uniref:PpiC domain-containing protein n=1 Tax=Anaerosacchariphilus polymeriproducens TaxID=1812858 RepID=A0A371AUW9_9FIRM|nr:peptidylprolyl isomerase [Anaerosacchariphilus polymeriproducens]RDU23374.1 hypothetical protein DWV06_09980 [Anaerosacchariphilus polymeriproducens]
MRKTGKYFLRLLILVMLIIIVSLIGCSIGKTKFVFTTGLGKDDVFKIGNKVCTYSEAMVLLTNAKNHYDSMFETDLWHEEFKGRTLEDYVKEETINKLSRIKCMDLLAEKKKISLDQTELKRAEKAAEFYYKSLQKEEIAYMNVNEKTLVDLYKQYALAVKAYNKITEDVQQEVSDDEARIVTVQQVFVKATDKNKETARSEAENILERAKSGEDFNVLMDLNPKGIQGNLTFGRGDMPDTYVKEAFELEDGQISDVIETEDGYFVIKCVCHLERTLTDANKAKISKERKETAFHEEYDNFIKELSTEFNNKLWDKVTLVKDAKIVTTSFFDVYNEYYNNN